MKLSRKNKVILRNAKAELLEENIQKGQRRTLTIRNSYILHNSKQILGIKSQQNEAITSFINILVHTKKYEENLLTKGIRHIT